MELLACFGRTGAGFGNDRYEKLLDESEAAIFNQLTKVSVLTCSGAKAIIEILNRHDLFGQPRVNVLAAKILKKASLDDLCKPEGEETHNQ